MGAISSRLPESLHNHLREFAQKEGTSIDQFATSALSEKMAALAAGEYLETRAVCGSREKFEAALAQVPNDPPDAQDTVISQVKDAQ